MKILNETRKTKTKKVAENYLLIFYDLSVQFDTDLITRIGII